jgi:aminoglycoside phosphotransferase (APT) family kinase protein
MGTADTDPLFQRVIHEVNPGAELLRTWRLRGGVSARVTAAEIRLPGGRCEKLVIREYGDANLRADPHAASHEARLLEWLRSAGVPVPAPRYTDESREILPRPYLVVEFVDGVAAQETQDDPAGVVRQLAAVLAGIHRAAGWREELPFLRDDTERFARTLRERPARLDDALSEAEVRAALTRLWPPASRNEPALLHGDFWPGNTLWHGGELAAVIDWEDAGFGDPLADLANGRLEISMFLGVDPMREFTGHYRSLMASLDYTGLPFWDLCAALRPAGKMSSWGLDAATLRKLQDGHGAFVRQALDAFSA